MPIDLERLSPQELKNLMANAKRLGNKEVYASAFARLCAVLPGSASDGSTADDPITQKFWMAVHAAEQVKTEVNGKTTMLSRTRQKVARDGIIETMESLAMKPQPSDGFTTLVGHELPHLVFEYIIAQHPDRFSARAVAAARNRLNQYEIPVPA